MARSPQNGPFVIRNPPSRKKTAPNLPPSPQSALKSRGPWPKRVPEYCQPPREVNSSVRRQDCNNVVLVFEPPNAPGLVAEIGSLGRRQGFRGFECINSRFDFCFKNVWNVERRQRGESASLAVSSNEQPLIGAVAFQSFDEGSKLAAPSLPLSPSRNSRLNPSTNVLEALAKIGRSQNVARGCLIWPEHC